MTRVSPTAPAQGPAGLNAAPSLVWIRDPENPAHAKATEAAFGDASVGIGSRAFRVLAIKPADAANDPLLAKYANSTAVVVVSRTNAVEAALVEPRLTAVDLFAAMRTSAAAAYVDDFGAAVVTTREVRLELAKIAADRKALEAEAVDAKTRAARTEALDAREKAAREREQRAWPLRLRAA